jgi:hypothetical protein
MSKGNLANSFSTTWIGFVNRCRVTLTHRERLLPFVLGQTREEKLAKFQLLFPSMAGVLTSVRITPSPQKREQMLREARNLLR